MPNEPTSLFPTAFPTIPACIAPRRFSVLTFNIHGGRTDHGLDLDAVIAEIRSARADVVLLQEVDRNLARTGFLNQPAMLAEALGMSVYYRANVRSNAILTRFPVMEWSSTALPQWPGKEERRLVHASVLVEGQLVHVFNTHLDHTSVALRLAQIRAVKSLVARYADAPMILGGDLNAIPGGPVLTTLRSDVSDAWPGVGEGSGNTVPAHDPRRRIDYLLHNSWLSTHLRSGPADARIRSRRASHSLRSMGHPGLRGLNYRILGSLRGVAPLRMADAWLWPRRPDRLEVTRLGPAGPRFLPAHQPGGSAGDHPRAYQQP